MEHCLTGYRGQPGNRSEFENIFTVIIGGFVNRYLARFTQALDAGGEINRIPEGCKRLALGPDDSCRGDPGCNANP